MKEKITILHEFYKKEGGRGVWDILGHIATNNYKFDLVPLGKTKAALPKWVLRNFQKRHSAMKNQRKGSRIKYRNYYLTTGAEVAERIASEQKLKPLVTPDGKSVTRSLDRFLTTEDPDDFAVWGGHLSCHGCMRCQAREYLQCESAEKGWIGPWIRLELRVK